MAKLGSKLVTIYHGSSVFFDGLIAILTLTFCVWVKRAFFNNFDVWVLGFISDNDLKLFPSILTDTFVFVLMQNLSPKESIYLKIAGSLNQRSAR